MRTAFFASVGASLILFMGCVLASSAPESSTTSAGRLDGSFGSSGVVLQTSAAGEFSYATGIAFLGNDTFAMSGTKLAGAATTGFITLYGSNGSPVGTSFSYDSTFLASTASDMGMNFAAAGTSDTSGTGKDFTVKLHSYYFNSTTDPTTYVTTYDSGYNETSLIVDMSGGGFDDETNVIVYDTGRNRYLAAGYAETSSGGQKKFAIAAIDKTTGALDATFGTGGKVLDDISASNDDCVNALAVLNDGSIVAGGYTDNGSSRNFALVKYNTNGGRDTGFGTGGTVTLDYSGNDTSQDSVSAVLLQFSSQIVAVGTTQPANGKGSILMARYYWNGSLDPNFGTGGVVRASFGDSNIRVASAALQNDGMILVTGCFEKVEGSLSSPGIWRLFVARFTQSGLLDPSFGTGGFVTASVKGFTSALPFAAAVNSSSGSPEANALLVAGAAGSSSSMNAAALRFVTQ